MGGDRVTDPWAPADAAYAAATNSRAEARWWAARLRHWERFVLRLALRCPRLQRLMATSYGAQALHEWAERYEDRLEHEPTQAPAPTQDAELTVPMRVITWPVD